MTRNAAFPDPLPPSLAQCVATWLMRIGLAVVIALVVSYYLIQFDMLRPRHDGLYTLSVFSICMAAIWRWHRRYRKLIATLQHLVMQWHSRITCLVTELAPGTMAPHERADFMQAKQKYESAHMFAHTLAGSTNLAVAAQLAKTIGGALQVHPRTQTSCLIELLLPC